ncbi:hypothetical protein F5B20DRAFT_580235 [Whalleya microplaca]|nr:hypothetical protein F5B20DRAFT_580235 [Whalleya microplaca]
MQLTSFVATALLPLLAVAETSTLTSTLVMTKYVTIQKVATTSSALYSANSTSSVFFPTGTGASSSAVVLPTTTTGADGSTTVSSPTVSPTINNNGGSSLGSAQVAFAGVAGLLVAAMLFGGWSYYLCKVWNIPMCR